MSEHFIEFRNVCKYYQMGENRIAAVDHINLPLKKGSFASLLVLPVQVKPPC